MNYDFNFYNVYVILLLIFFSCKEQLPKEVELIQEEAVIYPDYNQVVIPWNIAPMNFNIIGDGEAYRIRIFSGKGEGIITGGPEVSIDKKEWRKLLRENQGDTLSIVIYEKKEGRWIQYLPLKNKIAEEPIDNYISYRLIEPSYVSYEMMALCQRDLTGFEESVIYSNALLSKKENGQCINCHAYQNYNRTGTMQFHVREEFGGTVIVNDRAAEKINLKTAQTISGGVYPSWHPTEKLIAYSVNNTSQNFHTRDVQKVEVLDSESDIILYDIERNEVTMVASEAGELETFPSWSADGKYLYYVSAHFEPQAGHEYDQYTELVNNYRQIRYNIFRKPFDCSTRQFGETDTVLMASEMKKSATLPRESPDGKYLLFTMGDFGNFHIWHKSSDLYLLDLATGETQTLDEVNSPEAESYHSWSSNGRWIIFSSRREDGSYTRSYIAYFDKKGRGYKPFVLPQKDPGFYHRFFKSYNIPEFMVEPVNVSRRTLVKTIKKESKQACFSGDQVTVQECERNFYD